MPKTLHGGVSFIFSLHPLVDLSSFPKIIFFSDAILQIKKIQTKEENKDLNYIQTDDKILKESLH